MIDEKNEIINDLKQKVYKIISLYNQSIEKNYNLEQKNKKLIIELNNKKQEIKELQEKYTLLKVAKTVSVNVKDVNDTKNKINRIIREVDKCMALLNNE